MNRRTRRAVRRFYQGGGMAPALWHYGMARVRFYRRTGRYRDARTAERAVALMVADLMEGRG